MNPVRLFAVVWFATALFSAGSAVASPLTVLVRETVERACTVSGREVVERGARESFEHATAAAVRRQGPAAARAIQHGGIELLEATARHGDDVLKLAKAAGPAGQRALALEADRLVPLARQYGPVVLDLEARAPGLGGRVFTSFGKELAPAVAREAATEDLPRLLLAAGRADSPATRTMLWEGYQRGGGEFLKRIDWKVVMAVGVSAAVIDVAHRTTAPFDAAADVMRENPELTAETVSHVAGWASFGWGILPLAVVGCLLWRFGLMPWHRPRVAHRDPDHRDRGLPTGGAGSGPHAVA